jgi:hypothetical protein
MLPSRNVNLNCPIARKRKSNIRVMRNDLNSRKFSNLINFSLYPLSASFTALALLSLDQATAWLRNEIETPYIVVFKRS